jgi:hypothetical protein
LQAQVHFASRVGEYTVAEQTLQKALRARRIIAFLYPHEHQQAATYPSDTLTIDRDLCV